MGGVPARRIGYFDDLLNKRMAEDDITAESPANQSISQDLVNRLWEEFYRKHRG